MIISKSALACIAAVQIVNAATTASQILPKTFEDEYPRVVRNFVDKDAADLLKGSIMESIFPQGRQEPQDDAGLHPNLVSVFEGPGKDLELEPSEFYRATELVEQPESTHSIVHRMEYLQNPEYDNVNQLIQEVVPNTIMEEGGTIHMYMSSAGSSALANHTDVTDIFVLHLDGAKEWMLCEEHEEESHTVGDGYLTHKLNTCSTYNSEEIGTLECEVITLYPGDGLFLPKRVVHSAKAVSSNPSVHLTMAFIDSEYEKSKQETCNEYHTDIADLNSTNMADWLEEFELEILRGDGSGAAELRKLRQSQHRRLDCDKSSNPNASDCD